MTLKLPFQGESTLALVKSILQDPPQLSNIPNNYSPDLVTAVEGIAILLNYIYLHINFCSTSSPLFFHNFEIGLLVKDPKTRSSINNFLTSPLNIFLFYYPGYLYYK